ncbi:hypothetical protein [Butyrivibrio sp. MC2013]|uniref:hypothetical protein n=1 Tax=Butyrivibrio sp. MC2013 TaxID=1280686 RepID=UPI0004002872|nr:hypothetical protein [Butyrivibrio sp. MC2013]
MSVLTCVGNRAEKPCFIPKFNCRIFSIEELCRLIDQNALFIEAEDFTDELFDWIEASLSLHELADRLRAVRRSGAGSCDLAMTVIDYVAYHTGEEAGIIRERLKEGEGLDKYDKTMNSAGLLLQQGKLSAALSIYKGLERSLPAEASDRRAIVFHNEGVILARFFDFREAAECFRKEYENKKSQDAIRAYLCALRISMTEKEYVDYISRAHNDPAFGLDVEASLKDAILIYDAGEDKHRLRTLSVIKNEGKDREFKLGMEALTESFKREYREISGSGGVGYGTV